jgi:hypothetical protein
VSSRRLLIALAVVAFLAVSFELARYLSAPNAERSAIYALVSDAARGDAAAATARLEGCAGACATQVAAAVRRVRRPGTVKLLQLEGGKPPLAGTRVSRARVAWAADVARGGRAVVQCVTVRRHWSFTAGASITLLRLSAPISPETGC